MRPRIRLDLTGVSPYGAPVAEVVARLNVNENPYPPPGDVIDEMTRAVAAALVTANRYPDREAIGLRSSIAGYLGHGIDAAQVWAANGSNEVMHQIFSAYGGPGRTAMSFAPSYSMYPQYARDTFTSYEVVPREETFDLDLRLSLVAIAERDPAIVLLSSPNNPTGHAARRVHLERLLGAAEIQGFLLVVDEAYAEFMDPDQPTALDYVGKSPNLVVTRTLSKAFGLAGLRVGYAVAHPDVVADLQVVRLPYHLSATTQAAATVALDRAGELLGPVTAIRGERDRMQTWAEQQGLTSTPSQGNFLFLGRFADRHRVWQNLLDAGVLVRESGPDGWLRVSVGLPEENDLFMASMTEMLTREPRMLAGDGGLAGGAATDEAQTDEVKGTS